MSSSTRRAAPSTNPVRSAAIAPRAFGARPQHAEQEHGGDRRRDVRLHALQIDVELPAITLHQRDPREPEQHHEHRRRLARRRTSRRSVACGRELLVDVPRHERGAGVEHRRQRAHERREQARDDEPRRPAGSSAPIKRRQRLVRARRAAAAPRCGEHVGDDARHTKMKSGSSFRKPAKIVAAPRLADRSSRRARAARCTGRCTSTRRRGSARRTGCRSTESRGRDVGFHRSKNSAGAAARSSLQPPTACSPMNGHDDRRRRSCTNVCSTSV